MWRYLFVALLLAPLFIFPANVQACTAPPGGLPKYTITDHVRAAPIVLEGVVTNIAFVSNTPLHSATIQVARYYKGTGPTTITVDKFGPSSMCLSSVSQGNRYIFYVSGNSLSYSAFYMSQFDATSGTDPQTIDEVVAAAQSNTLITVMPPLTPTRSASIAPETLTARATLLTPNATLTAQRAIDLTVTAFALQATNTASAATRMANAPSTPTARAQSTPTPTPTPASLFSGNTGIEVVSLLGLGCLIGGFLGIAIGVLGMYLLLGRKND